jgi:hypothetical protein
MVDKLFILGIIGEVTYAFSSKDEGRGALFGEAILVALVLLRAAVATAWWCCGDGFETMHLHTCPEY